MLTTTLSLLSLATTALSIPLQLPFLSSSSSPTSALNLHPNSSTRPVRVSLGVMSRCPDASICEALWDRVLEERLPGSFGAPASVVSDLVDMELVFVAHENASAPYGATCMHGEQECRGNVQQLCAAAHWSTREGEGKKEKLAVEEEELEVALKGKQGWEDWWNFVQCMNYGDTTKIGSEAAAKQCARVVGREWTEQIASCVEGKQGRSLLVESLRRAERLDVERSCTVLIEGEQVCVHDGSWKSCPGGHEVRDFAREVREAWDKVNRGESRLDDDE